MCSSHLVVKFTRKATVMHFPSRRSLYCRKQQLVAAGAAAEAQSRGGHSLPHAVAILVNQAGYYLRTDSFLG